VDAAEIADAFGLDGASRLSDGPVARGKQGEVWRLDTADASWAVKVPFEPGTEDDVALSTQFHEAAYAAGVPTPGIRRTTTGAVFAGVDGRRVRLYEWVDLLAPDPMLDPELVGAAVAAVHQVEFRHDGPVDPWHHEPVGAARWDEVVALLRREGAPFAERLAGLRDELVALESWIGPPRTVRCCHCDLWADNVLPTTSGGVCIIDWENSGPADPAQELGCVLFEFGRSDPGRARALVTAYADAGGPARVRERADFTMLIAQLGHITEIAATDWVEPNPRSPDRAAAEEWISEVFDDPHTRDVLDGLLAWVRA
jgi:aminoglycoside phosphotransferase (APT) family kinase protein